MKKLILSLLFSAFAATPAMAGDCTPLVGNWVNAGRIQCQFDTGSEWKGERSTNVAPAKMPEPPDDDECPPKGDYKA
jgi:hypothetical protein